MRTIKTAGLLLVSCMICAVCQGTERHTIGTFKDLINIKKDSKDSYQIVCDIDGIGKPPMKSIKGFKGHFYGDPDYASPKIKNIKIDGSGLFETLTNATVSDIELFNIKFEREDSDNVGALAGSARGTKIENLQVTNSTISGKNNVGGLLGHSNNTKIFGSYVTTSTITGTGTSCGALVGLNDNASRDKYINMCWSFKNTVIGDREVGGLVGTNCKSLIKRSYFLGNSVTGKESVGGLVGYNKGSSEKDPTIDSCFVNCQNIIEGDKDVGGLVGKNEKTKVLGSNATNIKLIKGGKHAGGLAGSNVGGNITECVVSNVTVKGGTEVGGFVGYEHHVQYGFTAATSRAVVSDSNVSGSRTVGGLIGYADEDKVVESRVSGKSNITNTSNINSHTGGLIGYSNKTIYLQQCSVGENVTISDGYSVGGIIGDAHLDGDDYGESYIVNSYSRAKIKEEKGHITYVGGVVGYIYNKKEYLVYPLHITNCYFAGSIDDKERNYKNGLIGYVKGPVRGHKSFWLVNKGNTSWEGGSRLASEYELKSKKLYTKARWDSNIWNFHSLDYPTLKWEDDLVSSFSDDLNFDNDALAL